MSLSLASGAGVGAAPPSPSSSATSSLRLPASPAPLHSSTGSTHSHRHKPKALQRAEARLGVTTDYKDLSLHSAAANGNLGLVKYALMHGQPVNSVLNGVLPLHAAASSGNDEVVKMLIEHGADVNAPRLPRRYSNDRSRSSGIAVGTAGSTPLHFAAANGHVSIIQLLLSHGASPLLVEKNGLDPEAIALQKGHLAAAELLHAWIEDDADNDGASSSGTSLASSSKRRLHPQRSFDALALKLATHAPSPRHFPHSHSSSSLASSVPPNSSAHYGRRLSTSSHLLDPGSSHRRPSLPSVFEKAAHPVAGLKHVLGLSSLRRGSESQAQNSSGSGSSVASGFWGKAAAEHQAELDASSSGSASPARRSEESARQAPATAPPMQTSFFPGGGGGSDAGGSGLGSTRVARTTSIGSAKSAASASANFYRPRQSSQLSGRPSTTAWAASASAATSTAASSRVFEDDDVDQDDDDDGEGGARMTGRKGSEGGLPPPPPPSTSRGSTVRAPTSPLSIQMRSSVHHRQGSAASSAFSLNTAASRATLSSQETDVDEELGGASRTGQSTNDDTIKASRRKSAPADATLKAARRIRADSVDSEVSSVASRPTGSPLEHQQHLHHHHHHHHASAPPLPSSSTTPPPLHEDLLPPRPIETRSTRSNSAGTDTRFSSSSPASSYSGPGTLSTYAPSNSTVATSVHGGSNSPNPAVARQPGLAPLYEAKSDVSTSSSALVTTTSEQARRNVKKAERDLLQYKAGGASSTLSLSQQLAAYGQSLSIERKLKAQEADPAGSASSKYVWETLGKDGKRVVEAPSRGSSTLKVPKHSDVPTWLAIPSQDRLVPPSSPSGRRSVSPSHSHTSAPPTPSTRRSKESTSAAPIPSPAPTPSIPATPRASSPTSTASSSARPGVFSYVEVVPPTPVAKARTPTAAPRRSTGKSETTHSQKSSKDQVLLDAAEQARIAAAIPQAKITAPKKKAGFTRRLLGLA